MEYKTITKIGIGALALLSPVFTFAQGPDLGGLFDLGGAFLDFINGILVPIVFALAFLVFIWGVAKYFIFAQGDEGAKDQARSLMIYGIIGFFVMVAIWGIVNLLTNASGLTKDSLESGEIPDAPGPR